jgi:MFS family permease
MVAATQPFDADAPTPVQTLRALDAVNLFVAGSLAGFGPFVALFLGQQGWSPESIGFALTAGSLSGLLAQLPGGELLDLVRSKRFLLALGAGLIGVSALMIAFFPTFPVILSALILQGMSGAIIGLGIPAISLGVVGNVGLAERLGRNQRFQSGGSLTAATLMGIVGYYFSDRVIFFASALLVIPALVALGRIREVDIHFGQSVGAPDHHQKTAPPRARRLALCKGRSILIFAAVLFLFQMANASILPLVAGALPHEEGRQSSLILSALIVIPQVLVALIATWIGRQAKSWGRRPLLLIGLGALPIRAFLFTVIANPVILVGVQVLDGISGGVLGVLQPLVVADLTRGTGRFNLAQGLVAVISGVGASLSTAVSGLIDQSFGREAAFLAIGLIALMAFVICWAFMWETKPNNPRQLPRPDSWA